MLDAQQRVISRAEPKAKGANDVGESKVLGSCPWWTTRQRLSAVSFPQRRSEFGGILFDSTLIGLALCIIIPPVKLKSIKD